jgi:hypothetical protein
VGGYASTPPYTFMAWYLVTLYFYETVQCTVRDTDGNFVDFRPMLPSPSGGTHPSLFTAVVSNGLGLVSNQNRSNELRNEELHNVALHQTLLGSTRRGVRDG